MPNRFEWIEIAIVGIVGGLLGGVLALVIRLGASVDNLLNFLGGAVGSGLAVVATLWLENRKRARALRQLLNSMAIVADASLRFESIEDELMAAMVLTFQQATDALEASKLGVSIEDPLHQYGFHSAMFWVRRNMEEIKKAFSAFEGGTITNQEFASSARVHASTTAGSIEDFLRMKGLPSQPLKSLESAKVLRQAELNAFRAARAAR